MTESQNAAPSMTISDELAISAVLGGERAHFEVLMRRYNQRLFRTARAILKDDAEAEDAVQQTYLGAYSKLAQYRGDAPFGAWLTRIVVHESLRRRKKRSRLVDLQLVPETQAPVVTPEVSTHRGELRVLLEHAIDSLPETYRVVFVMRDVEEFTTAEVAAALDLSEEAVRVRLHRARRALRAQLYERLDEEVGDVFGFAGDRCDRIVVGVFEALEDP